MLLQNVVRTSLVTCFVPILMVGGAPPPGTGDGGGCARPARAVAYTLGGGWVEGRPHAPSDPHHHAHTFTAPGVVTAYNEANKQSDSMNEKFAVYFALCAAMYPCGRLLQWVERFAPLWLGGHIVGFLSFFGWMLYSEADLLKSDKLLTK